MGGRGSKSGGGGGGSGVDVTQRLQGIIFPRKTE